MRGGSINQVVAVKVVRNSYILDMQLTLEQHSLNCTSPFICGFFFFFNKCIESKAMRIFDCVGQGFGAPVLTLFKGQLYFGDRVS